MHKMHEKEEGRLDSISMKALDLAMKIPAREKQEVVEEGSGGEVVQHTFAYKGGNLGIEYGYTEFMSSEVRKVFFRHMKISYKGELVLSAYLKRDNRVGGYTIFKWKKEWEGELDTLYKLGNKDASIKLRGSKPE
ncbi:MAG: hypothetical protein KGI06_05110 [Candidatus Micrarchaeota archaeon]|nr:hypothetical protein [Candidatus Micrarchaeota archaeon]